MATLSVKSITPTQFVQIAKLVAIAKFNASGRADELIIQGACVASCGASQRRADLRAGEAKKAGAATGDQVEVRYAAWLLQGGAIGQEFDNNAAHEKPFRFQVGKGAVIRGWDQGVVGMKKGAKRLLVIPAALAYGAQGVPARVPANTLAAEPRHIDLTLAAGRWYSRLR